MKKYGLNLFSLKSASLILVYEENVFLIPLIFVFCLIKAQKQVSSKINQRAKAELTANKFMGKQCSFLRNL